MGEEAMHAAADHITNKQRQHTHLVRAVLPPVLQQLRNPCAPRIAGTNRTRSRCVT
jgi:hypothetical protein